MKLQLNKKPGLIINKLLTEKFCTTLETELSKIKVSEPISMPYNKLQHKYYALVDQLRFLACKLELPKTTLQSLSKNLNHFKERLFNPVYCNARPNIL